MTPACASFYGTHADRERGADEMEAEDYRELACKLAKETGLDRAPN